MASKQGKQPALKLNLPGAGEVWHVVVGLPGLYHPSIAVPRDDAKEIVDRLKKQAAEARKAWGEFEAAQEKDGKRPAGPFPFVEPPCPVELVELSEAEAEKGREAHAEALAASRNAVRRARRGSREEQVLAESEAAAISGAGNGGQ